MTPTLAEIAYRAWCGQQPTPQPLYKALTFEEQLGWAMAVQHALEAALEAPRSLQRASDASTLLHDLAGLRRQVLLILQAEQWSLKTASRIIGLNRRTLSRWLAGEENITVRTLLRLEAWLAHQGR